MRRLSIAAASTLVLAGCASGTTASPSSGGTPRQGGSITMSMPQDGISFDPAYTSAVSAADGNRLTAVYDALVWTDPATDTVRPQLAESLEQSSALDWVLTLRPGVTFSDGTPFDAEAVKENWARHQDPNVRSLQAAAADTIQSMQVDSPTELKIHLYKTNANFDHMVSHSLNFIASPAALKDPQSLAKHPVGAGPFLLKSWTPGENMVMVRNPTYWQRDKGMPYLDQITYTVDGNVAHATSQVGRTNDITMTVDPMAVADAQANSKVDVDKLTLNGGQEVVFNLDQPPFDNLTARKAFVLSLSAKDVNDTVFAGKGTIARSIFNSTSPLANIELSTQDDDFAQATALWNQVTKNGTQPVTISYVVPEGTQPQAVGAWVASRLNRFNGVHVNVETLNIGAYLMKIRKQGDWQVALSQSWIDDPDPAVYDMFHSDGQSNNGDFRNADVDAALETARASTDTETRRDAYTQVQILISQQLPVYVYQEALAAAVYSPKLTGIQLCNDGLLLWDRVGLRS